MCECVHMQAQKKDAMPCHISPGNLLHLPFGQEEGHLALLPTNQTLGCSLTGGEDCKLVPLHLDESHFHVRQKKNIYKLKIDNWPRCGMAGWDSQRWAGAGPRSNTAACSPSGPGWAPLACRPPGAGLPGPGAATPSRSRRPPWMPPPRPFSSPEILRAKQAHPPPPPPQPPVGPRRQSQLEPFRRRHRR